jgi:hypothetical protein
MARRLNLFDGLAIAGGVVNLLVIGAILLQWWNG